MPFIVRVSACLRGKMAENSNQENGENVESLSPTRPISEKSKQMSDESEGSEQSDTLNRNMLKIANQKTFLNQK